MSTAMRSHLLVRMGLVLVGLGLAGVVRAEVPVLKQQELEQQASHIVTGKLQTIYRSVQRSADYESTRGLAEVVADKVEKGAGVRPGEAVFVRFWTERWIGKGSPPPGSSGHHVPAEGARVRAYVVQGKDGSFEMLLPNGLETLPGKD